MASPGFFMVPSGPAMIGTVLAPPVPMPEPSPLRIRLQILGAVFLPMLLIGLWLNSRGFWGHP